MTITDISPDTVVERVQEVVPLIREHSAEGDRLRHVPQQTIDALERAGAFRLCVPRRYGGLEADFETQMEVFRAIGQGCSSAAWVVNVLTTGAWIVGLFSDQAQDEVFTTPDIRVASIFNSSGAVARRVEGGVQFETGGFWRFNTGVLHSDWDVLSITIREDDGSSSPAWVLVPVAELTIHDDWDTSMASGTGSCSVESGALFVPTYRVVSPERVAAGDMASEQNVGNTFFKTPFMSFSISLICGVALGIAEGASMAFLEQTRAKRAAQSTSPIIHMKYGEIALKTYSIEAHARRAVSILQAHQGVELPEEARVAVRAASAYTLRLAREVVDEIFSMSGASAIRHGVPIQQYERDVLAFANHQAILATTNFELYGKTLCELPADAISPAGH